MKVTFFSSHVNSYFQFPITRFTTSALYIVLYDIHILHDIPLYDSDVVNTINLQALLARERLPLYIFTWRAA